MARTTRLPIAAAALAALLVPLTFLGVPSMAATAPELAVSVLPVPDNPLEVASYDESDSSPERTDVALTVRPSETLTDVTVTVVESDGLYVDPLVTGFDSIGGDRAELVRFAVRGRTTGLHTLTFEITAPGVEPKQVSLPYVWTPGGPPLPGGDSLAGRMYGANGLGSYGCTPNASCTFRTSDRVVFRNDLRASDVLAVDGTQSCPKKRGCSRYHYDASTRLVQVGSSTIGRVTPGRTFIDGERYTRLVYPKTGARLNGRWQYGANVDEGRGVVEQRLDLRRNGRFRLTYAVDTHRYPDTGIDTTYSRTLKGRYRIGDNGRIAFKDARRGTKVATLALATNKRGQPRSTARGVWLDLAVNPPDGKPFVDGNLLNPLPRSAG